MVILRELVVLPLPGGGGINHFGLEDHHVVVLEDGQGASGGVDFRQSLLALDPGRGYESGFSRWLEGPKSTTAVVTLSNPIVADFPTASLMPLFGRSGR